MKKTTKKQVKKKAPIEYFIRIEQGGDKDPIGCHVAGPYYSPEGAAEEGYDEDVIYKITPVGKVVHPDPEPEFVPFE